MGSVSFQILSDLHLETQDSYDFDFDASASNLALLGDVGHVADPRLFEFLDQKLEVYSTVFFLLGNHEPWHMSFKQAKQKMRIFERNKNLKLKTKRFVFLDQTRHDVSNTVTVLGCTLFSHILPHQDFVVESILVDFKDIARWTTEAHNDAHKSDLQWLNTQVTAIARDEPERRIVIFTHHCPSIDSRCQNPRFAGKAEMEPENDVSSGFATDLSKEECWTNPAVVGWAYGHTHFNCEWRDSNEKIVVSNQRGYKIRLSENFEPGKRLIIQTQSSATNPR
ncbi:hypothetical protein N7462_011623 [Penicillium macrosclerotiorum]|uniref:uncharacterized protein n=1 Tax=Penicillium macrosclerotiorum TaxID=303699 RepID=UPI00254795A2|nr:uncharacterized protein N7462_011623 [Penicillium macrosclerotiorum]KAJ5662697.1 hypothetical protein N7462_011623 [Penicillium macrosclerotiorum]